METGNRGGCLLQGTKSSVYRWCGKWMYKLHQGIPNEFEFIFENPDVMSLADYNQSDSSCKYPSNWKSTKVDISKTGLSSSHPWGQFGQDNDPCLLDPQKLQPVFQQCVKGTIQDHYKSTNWSFELKLRGPAVCVFMDIQTSDLKKYTENDTGLLKLLSSLETEIWIKQLIMSNERSKRLA